MGVPVTFTAFIRDGGIDEVRNRVTALVKTTETDRHRTLFLPEAFARTLPVWLGSNPIFLWQHRSGKDANPEDALGHAVDGRITQAGPEVTFHYAVEVNPQAKLVWDLVLDRTIRAFSIGGWIIASVDRRRSQAEIDALPDYARKALLSGECDEVVIEIELAEISQVLIGSDRGALIGAVARGLLSEEMALRMLDQFTETEETRTMADSPAVEKAPQGARPLENRQAEGYASRATTPTDERGMVPAQMDAAARLMGVMRCISECGYCRCTGCDCWEGCRCEASCCCCLKDGDCGTCSCCQADAKIIVGCCDILDAVGSALKGKYSPGAPGSGSMAEQGTQATDERSAEPDYDALFREAFDIPD